MIANSGNAIPVCTVMAGGTRLQVGLPANHYRNKNRLYCL